MDPKTIDNYLKSLGEKDLKAYHIAKDHLGSSFSVEKSVGFLTWLKSCSSSTQTI